MYRMIFQFEDNKQKQIELEFAGPADLISACPKSMEDSIFIKGIKWHVGKMSKIQEVSYIHLGFEYDITIIFTLHEKRVIRSYLQDC